MSLLGFVMWLVMMQQENNGTTDSVAQFNNRPPDTLTICGTSGCVAEPPLVTISLEDGKATFGPKFTQDEASRVFWTTLVHNGLLDRVVISQEFWREVEKHCVAVLTEKHVEKRPVATYGEPTYGEPLQEVKDGEEIIHVPEQTLKLRCK